MFIEINHAEYNMYSISSFRKFDRKLENGDGNYTDAFYIIYTISNAGWEIEEKFSSETERNNKYNWLIEKFGLSQDSIEEE